VNEKQAHIHANALAKKLNAAVKKLGMVWKPRVHKSLGWHASAISECERWCVTYDKYGLEPASYMAFVSPPTFGCAGVWSSGRGSDPVAAVVDAKAKGLKDLQGKAKLLDMEVVPK